MCLMQTDFPVPDGPRIIEILSFGMPMLRPRRILLRPNALWTSMNSTASSTPDGRFLPVCHWYSSSACRRAACRCLRSSHPPMGARGFAPQNTWVPSMPIRWTSTMLRTIDFAVAVPTPTGPPLAV